MDNQQVDIVTAAERMGVSEKTVRRLVKSGQLAAVKVDTPTGFVYRINAEEVEKQRVSRGQTAIVPVQAEERLRRVVIETVGQQLEQLGSRLSDGQAEWAGCIQATVQALGDVVVLRERLAEVGAEAARAAQERDIQRARADRLEQENGTLREALDVERRRSWWKRVTGRRNGG